MRSTRPARHTEGFCPPFFMNFLDRNRLAQRRPPGPRKPKPSWFLSQLRKFQERRRLQRMRPRPADQPSLLQRTLAARWRNFMLQRSRRRTSAPAWTLSSLLNPGRSEAIATLCAVAIMLRRASKALIWLTLIPLVFNAIPVRLSGPEWYLQVINAMGESAPVWILAYLLGMLSLALVDQGSESLSYHRRLTRSSRVLSLIVLMLIPLQLGFVVWLYAINFDTRRAQLNAVRSQANALISEAKQQSSKDAFVSFLRSRGITANLDAIEASPLSEVKSAFIQRAELERGRQEQAIANASRDNLLRYSTNSLKLLATLVVFALFMLGLNSLMRRSLLHRMSIEDVEQAASSGQ